MNATINNRNTLSLETSLELDIKEAVLKGFVNAGTYASPEDVVECSLADLEQVYQNAIATAKAEFDYALAYINHAKAVRLAESSFVED